MVGAFPEIDERYRSLLQKAVRRGSENLVYTVSALLEDMGAAAKSWYRTQVPVIVFEECWPLGAELIFTKKYLSKVAALVKTTRSRKSRDAIGLGYLAHALYAGNQNVLDGGPDDHDLKTMAKAIRAPDEFWHWIESLELSARQRSLTQIAYQFRKSGYPHDRAVIQAAAYLAATQPVPPTGTAAPSDAVFPYWVAFDHHTRRGNRVLRDIARDLHLPLQQLEWVSYYCEAALTNAETPSKWWQKYCRWHFEKIDLPLDEAHLIWDPVRPQVVQALAQDARNLQSDLYRWKMGHLDAVAALKRQVGLLIEHFEGIRPDQLDLF